MHSIIILGNGQLGQMLRQAGEPIGITVWPVALDANIESVPLQDSIITTEIEHWPETALTNAVKKHKYFVNRDIFPIITDRLKQRKLLNKLQFSTVRWKSLVNKNEWPFIFDSLGKRVIVKKRVGGYNGCGQWYLSDNKTCCIPKECYGTCIVDQNVNFVSEVSLVGARAYNGNTVFYPLTHNLHKEGTLKISVAFPSFDTQQQIQAEEILCKIMHELDYIGVMAMECFITSNGCLLINELSPRVHNSAHWTQNGASINQFELHLRAITRLPLPKPLLIAPSIMINLIGTELNYNWLKFSTVYLHWYYKEIFPGRKVGHLNLIDNNTKRLSKTLESLVPFLPQNYHNEIVWALSKIEEKTN